MMTRNRIRNLLMVVLSLIGLSTTHAQTGVYNGSPTSFMHLHDNLNWVQLKYSTSYTANPSTNGSVGLTSTTDGSGYHSHAYVTANANGTSGTDCASCFEAVPGSGNYNRNLNIMASAWDGSGGIVDTVIQLGDRWGTGTSSAHGHKCQSITYAFKPDTNNPVLLVQYAQALQNASHNTYYNPRIEIKLTDANGTLLQLPSYGNCCYYPNDYYTNYSYSGNYSNYTISATVNGNFGPHGIWDANYNDNAGYVGNTNWPYSRYVFAALGNGDGSNTSFTHSDMTPCFVDPDFESNACPYASQPSGCCYRQSNVDIISYPYTIVAFNLTQQARNGETVKLVITKLGCQATFHWAEMYYTAKMVPGKIEGNVCNSDTNLVFDVPWGFKTYEWFGGFNSTTKLPLSDFSGSQTMTVNRTTEQVYPYYCCIMQSYTGVPFLYEANLVMYDLQARGYWEQYVGDCSYNVRFCDTSMVCQMVPEVVNNVLTGEYERTYMNSWQRNWLYKDENGGVHLLDGGHPNDSCFNYTFQNVDGNSVVQVGLAIWDNNGTCYSDTLWMDITFDETMVTPGEATDTITTCEETIVYDAATFGNTYTWNSPGTRPVVYTGASWNGCDSTVKVTYILQKPRINSILTSDEYCDEFYTTLSVDANVDVETYQWSYQYNGDTTFNDGVDPNAAEITITKPGVYTVKIIDEGGCEATSEITIDACKPFINLPNAITPSNYDGLNDCVEVVQRDLLQTLEFSVYNRNGELVYYTTDKNFCWDGRVKGRLITNVTYNWRLVVLDYNGANTMYKGSIVVL